MLCLAHKIQDRLSSREFRANSVVSNPDCFSRAAYKLPRTPAPKNLSYLKVLLVSREYAVKLIDSRRNSHPAFWPRLLSLDSHLLASTAGFRLVGTVTLSKVFCTLPQWKLKLCNIDVPYFVACAFCACVVAGCQLMAQMGLARIGVPLNNKDLFGHQRPLFLWTGWSFCSATSPIWSLS